MRARFLSVCVVSLAAALAASCGGSGGDTPSDDELRGRLLPARQLDGFTFHRGFVWTNAIDLTGEGLHTSENTRPADIVNAIEDAGFVKGAGEELQKGSVHGPMVAIAALKFDSDGGADDVRDLLHDEYLKQPCYGICSQKTSELAVSGIPGARAEASQPDPAAPPEVQPGFQAYAVEFTIGPYLYVVGGAGGPGEGIKEPVLDAAQKLYARVRDRPD